MKQDQMKDHDGTGFLWGVAQSAAQTESREGRGRSNWDVFADTPGHIHDGSTNARCIEFETRYEQDLDILKAAGVPAFRFSTAWPRIQPDGPGKPSQAGLDLYSRVVDAALARGIQPWVTLFHWDVPVWAGDFRERDIAQRLADYAGLVVDALSDRVNRWIVYNEPNTVALQGYAAGVHAPGLQSMEALAAAIHHQNLSIGLMTQAVRARVDETALVGTTHNVAPARGASDSAADQAAAGFVDVLWNTAFLDPLFGKGYPAAVEPLVSSLVKPGDMDIIAAKPDFLGLNYYMRLYMEATSDAPGFRLAEPPAEYPRTALFHVEPDGLTEGLEWVTSRYGSVPIYITETGFALDDGSGRTLQTDDPLRSEYLENYLAAAAQAKANGADLRGLFYWAATDNWEWAEGFTKQFGAIAVDVDTQERRAKLSLARLGDDVRRAFSDATSARKV